MVHYTPNEWFRQGVTAAGNGFSVIFSCIYQADQVTAAGKSSSASYSQKTLPHQARSCNFFVTRL
jgi:hypothetical protein